MEIITASLKTHLRRSMDKGQRCLLTLAGGCKKPILAQRRGSRTIVTNPPSKNIYEQAQATSLLPQKSLEDSPFFLGLKPDKKKVAITDIDGDFTYEDLFKRSFYLSLEIKKALRGQENKNQKINLICPNGVSYVIGQWAIWMSGNIVVPLSGQHSDEALEYFIKDSDSALVITAPTILDKVENLASKINKPLICQDQNMIDRSNINIDDNGPLIFNENLYPSDEPVMMLYYPGRNGKAQRLHLKHKDINRELDLVNKVWDLDENSSILHALSLYNAFGIIASLMGPLSAGGRVVLLDKFDTTMVWSHLLGIQMDGRYVPKTNYYAGVPLHYEALMKRYSESFTNTKIKDHIRDTCYSRMKMMVNGVDNLDPKLQIEWANMTGHAIQLY